MSQGENKTRLHTVSALMALVLTACGGGGDGDSVAVTTPPPPAPVGSAPVPPPPPPPAPAPTSPTAIAVAGDVQAQPNQRYEVRAAAGVSELDITLPPTAQLSVGNTIAITGVSATSWRVAQNAGQSIVTTSLAGNAAAGTSWTPHLTPRPWWWMASNAAGDVLTAGEIGGGLWVSTDAGATWAERGSDADRIWISSDMTPSGDRIVALAYNDRPYISSDRGATFTPINGSAPGLNDFATLQWESVAISSDGQRIVAAALNEPLRLSVNGGLNWTPVGTAARWRGVAMSMNGERVVAIDQGGQIHLSSNSGTSFAPLTGAPTADWYRVSMSDDGQVIAAAERFDGGLWVSRNAGVNWTRVGIGGSPVRADWTTVSVSGDGSKIAATATALASPDRPASTPATTQNGVFLSENGGADFRRLTTAPGTDTNWRSVALSRDGNQMVAATGGTVGTRVEGQLYTSVGNRTSVGTSGGIVGGQNQSVTLEYLGVDQGVARFGVREAVGGAFVIR